jgi:small subunit ribosomal protein S9
MWRTFECLGSRARPQCQRAVRRAQQQPPISPSRCISTTTARHAQITEEAQEPFQAAPELEFDNEDGDGSGKKGDKNILRTLRVVPASPSYFSAKPTFTDDFLSLSALLRKVATLPTIPNAEAPKVAWKTIDQYRIMTNEPVKTQRYHKMLHILRRLNCIHPSLMPDEVLQAMLRYKKPNQPGDVLAKPGIIDELGRSKGVGRRKTSSAVAWLVDGEGEALVNGKSLSQFFGRLHHRESAVWALKATHRLDKYNIFALVRGGGLTGQAEALTLAVAKALLVHEPALKPALRRGKSTSFPTFLASSSHVVVCMVHIPLHNVPRSRLHFTSVSNRSPDCSGDLTFRNRTISLTML